MGQGHIFMLMALSRKAYGWIINYMVKGRRLFLTERLIKDNMRTEKNSVTVSTTGQMEAHTKDISKIICLMARGHMCGLMVELYN